tara:strand:+ start:9620 stop:10072 length:453 start_codon:yes stop_codon:yes gene_type:complete
VFNSAKYSLKTGDAIITAMGIGILTRKTRTYWYYLFKNKIARVRKSQLWDMIDIGSIEIKYGRNNKYRRLKTTNRSLNLSGLTNRKSEDFLNNFLDFVELPCKILIGQDEERLEFVQETLRDDGYIFFVQDEIPPSPYRPIIRIVSKGED